MLPGVFAVEDDRNERVFPAASFTVAAARFDQPPDEVLRGASAAQPEYVKPIKSEDVVAKRAGDRPATGAPV
jgi:hypothetical protein